MDEAHRAVKLIKSASVWENMAHMCVKTKRLDVAEVCLGNMQHAHGSAAVRRAKAAGEPLEACIAAVAVQLGLLNDAVRLYKECGRMDLLNKLYQAAGEWRRALEVAERCDRIHLKTTHHQYAQHLEAVGDVAGAIEHYERADTHRTEVPRMLFAQERLAELEDYVNHRGRHGDGDPELLKWWAGYCESRGHFEKAQDFYRLSKDYQSLVRVACFNHDTARAYEIVRDTGDLAASYHLARQLESVGEVQEAISFYATSGCYNHAIRLAKQYSLDADLMAFAIKARPSLMIDCAAYFEQRGEFEKAVQLYQKGGDVAKALDICFKAGAEGRATMFEVLNNIATNLSGETSPAVLARCAEFFLQHEQYEQAVKLYVAGKRFTQAIQLCADYRVKLTDEIAESLTPPKEGEGAPKTKEERNEVLAAIARAAKKGGLYQLACKKYTEAGDRVRAMKCLLKSGDTKKVLYYAGVSRNREIYVLAANYLQSLDWQNDGELMKKIVEFYLKAKAYEQLSSFYDAYAQVEIDEYRDYDKALGALKEAAKHLGKARAAPDRDHALAALQQRVFVVEQFTQARRLEKSNPDKMVQMCHSLLEQPDCDSAIRVGDCFALLVEYYHARREWPRAYQTLEDMRRRRIVLHPYLEADLIAQIHEAVGEPIPAGEAGSSAKGGGGGGGGGDDDVDEDIDEDVPDDVPDDSDASRSTAAPFPGVASARISACFAPPFRLSTAMACRREWAGGRTEPAEASLGPP
jgi:intraflagellar transport protein 140